MISSVRMVTRIGLFSAIVYVLSWATIYLPNVSLAFFVIFSSGLLWGLSAGLLVGAVGIGVWTMFNPYGPAHPYIMLAQISGAALSGLIGYLFHRAMSQDRQAELSRGTLMLAGGLCALLYFIPVIVVDAWLFQPFKVRLIAGLPWVALSIGANMIIFPMLFPVTRRLLIREGAVG